MPTLRLRRPDGSEYQHPLPPDFYDHFLVATDEPVMCGDLLVSQLRVTHPDGKSFDEFQKWLTECYQQIPEELRFTAEVNLDYDMDDEQSTFCLSYRRRRTAAEQASHDEFVRQQAERTAERTEVFERSELNRLLIQKLVA